jgi:hypothetical protein
MWGWDVVAILSAFVSATKDFARRTQRLSMAAVIAEIRVRARRAVAVFAGM